jgi:acyl-coenzyme A synthetase/AMP-(fatty) acid ligase
MTAEFVAFHATERPGAVALVNNGREISYAEFSRDIRKFTRALRDFGLPRGASAAVESEDVYAHWLMRLAFEELDVVTASLPADASRKTPAYLREFDLVMSRRSIPTERVRRHHVVTPEWLKGVLARTGEGEAPATAKSPDDPLRILYTSGTTGTPKKIVYSRWIHERSVTKSMWFNGVTGRSRYLLTIPFSVGSSYANATACLRSGGTVVVEDRMPVGQAIGSLAITHVALPPIHLKQVLDELPERFAKPAELTIFSFGAAVASALCDRAFARLATEICDMYGSNEAGYVSSIRSRQGAEFGCVWPGVRIEIVDEGDRPLPLGELGRIRVKTDCMVQGYANDPEATRRMFRDGWFYAGDMGILRGARRLQVVGRDDDLLNVGWSKLSPSALEERVLRVVEVGDVGICSVSNAEGIERVCVVVAGARDSDQELLSRITVAFADIELGRFYLLRVPHVPRNANGKIRRDLLKRVAATLVASQTSGFG